jgi:hypothetical protein
MQYIERGQTAVDSHAISCECMGRLELRLWPAERRASLRLFRDAVSPGISPGTSHLVLAHLGARAGCDRAEPRRQDAGSASSTVPPMHRHARSSHGKSCLRCRIDVEVFVEDMTGRPRGGVPQVNEVGREHHHEPDRDRGPGPLPDRGPGPRDTSQAVRPRPPSPSPAAHLELAVRLGAQASPGPARKDAPVRG